MPHDSGGRSNFVVLVCDVCGGERVAFHREEREEFVVCLRLWGYLIELEGKGECEG